MKYEIYLYDFGWFHISLISAFSVDKGKIPNIAVTYLFNCGTPNLKMILR